MQVTAIWKVVLKNSNDGYLESTCNAENKDFKAHQIDKGNSGFNFVLNFTSAYNILCSMWTTTTECKSKDYWYCRFKLLYVQHVLDMWIMGRCHLWIKCTCFRAKYPSVFSVSIEQK